VTLSGASADCAIALGRSRCALTLLDSKAPAAEFGSRIHGKLKSARKSGNKQDETKTKGALRLSIPTLCDEKKAITPERSRPPQCARAAALCVRVRRTGGLTRSNGGPHTTQYVRLTICRCTHTGAVSAHGSSPEPTCTRNAPVSPWLVVCAQCACVRACVYVCVPAVRRLRENRRQARTGCRLIISSRSVRGRSNRCGTDSTELAAVADGATPPDARSSNQRRRRCFAG
jgi:hypothetical protein